MTGGVAESWARLRLVQGDSTAQAWELGSSRGQTTLTVGSGPSSSWVVREEGVRPLHFSLHWDGSTLRIADTYGAGDVRVDGAPVTAQWRSLVGRVRIDFGKGAMVAETSSAARPESVHPVEPSPLPQIVSSNVSVEPALSSRLHKATLIGVSSSSLAAPAPDAAGGDEGVQSRAPESGAQAADAFKRPRASDSERAHKATLLGIAISVPPPASVGPGAEARPSTAQEVKPSTPSKGLANRTLLGVAVPLEARLQLLSGLSGQSSDQGGGVSMDDLRSGRPASSSPPPANGAVTQAEVPAAPRPGDATERIGSSWHETPEPRKASSHPPMAVLVDPPQAGEQQPRAQPLEDDGATYAAHPGADYERYSDAPTTMRDAPSLDSRRAREPFPWRYVGIGLLTAAAYFAWLYLLDHL
jgi:hypothetical protein